MDKSVVYTLYNKGAKVWVPHESEVWECAEIVEPYDGKEIKVITGSNEVKVLTASKYENLPPLRNPDILIGENDLTSLSYLHEPAVLYNLLVRFVHRGSIYTYCGIVLVAINPYEELPIYDDDTIRAYRGRALGELEPHIFAISEEAFTRIESEKKDQSIIVSGESGAGKTVSAKYVMRYFATVSGSSKETQVEKKVLASSPIMEAFGNAKTTRNDNSSRFGKFIELQFNKRYEIVGASMRTYLLEKSRVVFQAEEERNYHIFYQLCASRQMHPELKLESAEKYTYLSSNPSIIGVDDEKTFKDTLSAMTILKFTPVDQNNIFRILASILHLGNIKISESSHSGHQEIDASYIAENDRHLIFTSELLCLDKQDLRFWLCHRKIVSIETFDKPMTVVEAEAARDALAKHLYARLFSWIVSIINRVLETCGEKHRFIGVLDIYGFETFPQNSFEQFCINYANEKLQQQFNLHVFKLDQEEYTKEGIEWKFIDFYDNQPCIDMIETRLGILDLLDEECRMPKGTDNSWCEKLYTKCDKWKHFSKPRFGNSSFIIRHFADSVEYQVAGFLEKNKDTVIEEQIVVLQQSANKLLKDLFCDDSKLHVTYHASTIGHSGKLKIPAHDSQRYSSATLKPSKQHQHKKTVGSQFRDSLTALMNTLNVTTPHYIRCIKPNDMKLPFKFNSQRAVQQLRACGVLETIRISAAGFPSRVLYSDFHSRYKLLCNRDKRKDVKASCAFVIDTLIKDEDKYKYGKTKIFFRAGQVAYLEKLRSQRLKECCIAVQKNIRTFLARRRYLRILNATKLLQRVTRGYLARRRVYHIRRNRAAVTLQRYLKGWVQRNKYTCARKSVLLIQTHGRGVLARRRYRIMKENHAATIIQAKVRCWLAHKRYTRIQRSIVVCQSAVRRYLAKKALKQLKREARSVERMKKLNKGLENKIISLQQRIDEMQKEMLPLQSAYQELNELKLKMEELKSAEQELKQMRVTLAQREMEHKQVLQELDKERKEKENALLHSQSERDVFEEKYQELKQEKENLLNSIEELKEYNLRAKRDIEDMIKTKVKHEKMILVREQDEDREAYQKLLSEKNALEIQVDWLQKEMMKHEPDAITRGHQRSISNASTVSLQDAKSVSPDSAVEGDVIADKPDIVVILKLQQKLRALQAERDKFQRRADVATRTYIQLQHNIKMQNQSKVHEMEMESVKAQKNLKQAKEANEDGELYIAFEVQKKINRQLEDELQTEKAKWLQEKAELLEEIDRLKKDNDRQQNILSMNLTASVQSQMEAFLHSEIVKLSAENLEIRDKCEVMQKEYWNLKKQLEQLQMGYSDKGTDDSAKTEPVSIVSGDVEMPIVKKKDGFYRGMFAFTRAEITPILRHLIYDLHPSVAAELIPGFPAYIIFMCIRHTDITNDEERVRDLLHTFIMMVKKLVKRRQNDLDVCVLWFSNVVKLLQILKQYGGDQMYQEENTPTQNAQCLQNFDLSEYHVIFSDTAVIIYQTFIKFIEERIHNLALSAILEHEALSGLSSGKQLTRSQSVSSADTSVYTPDILQKELTSYFHVLLTFGVDMPVIVQVFKQLFYYICAITLNNLLLRSTFCRWTKGIQIRFNLSHLEQWARDQNIQTPETHVVDELLPIVQASQLLQARKTEDDVNAICDMCNRMTLNQIVKILNMYTPEDYEERISMSFIKKVQDRLQNRAKANDHSVLLMDTKLILPIRFPFTPSNIMLEDIEIPPSLDLSMLRKL